MEGDGRAYLARKMKKKEERSYFSGQGGVARMQNGSWHGTAGGHGS